MKDIKYMMLLRPGVPSGLREWWMYGPEYLTAMVGSEAIDWKRRFGRWEGEIRLSRIVPRVGAQDSWREI